MDGASRLAVPQHGSFALVGDPDGRQIARLEVRLLHGFGDHLLRAEPDLVGIVFHPAGLGIDLFVFLLGRGGDPPRPVENDEARAGSSLVDGSDVVWHRSTSLTDCAGEYSTTRRPGREDVYFVVRLAHFREGRVTGGVVLRRDPETPYIMKMLTDAYYSLCAGLAGTFRRVSCRVRRIRFWQGQSRPRPRRSLWLWKTGRCRFLGKSVPCGLPARPRSNEIERNSRLQVMVSTGH